MTDASRAGAIASSAVAVSWSDDHPFLLALAVSVVAHVLFFVFGPAVKVPAPSPRPVLEVKLIEPERKPPPPPPPVVIPEPPKPAPAKSQRRSTAKPAVAKTRPAAAPRLSAQVAPPSQPLPVVQRDAREQPQTRVQAQVPSATKVDAPVVPRIEARADIAPRPIADLPLPRTESRPRVDVAARPDLAPVARAEARAEMPRLEARTSAPTDPHPTARRDVPAEPRRDVSAAVPRPEIGARPQVTPLPAVAVRGDVPGDAITLPTAVRPSAPAQRPEIAAEPRRDAAVQRPQAPVQSGAMGTEVRVESAVAPSVAVVGGVVRPQSPRADPSAEPRRDVAVQRPQAPVPPAAVGPEVRVDPGAAPTVAVVRSQSARPEPSPELRRDVAVQRPQAPVQSGAAGPEVRVESAAVPSVAAVRPQSARAEPRPDPRPDPAAALRPRVPDSPDAVSRPVLREDVTPARPAAPATPPVADLRKEPPPAPKPPADRPTVAPAPPTSAPAVARVTPPPAVTGPAIDPKRETGPRVGGPQGAVVAGARPTLGGAPRGDGYDREAAVKYAEKVATEIQKRIRYPRMAERAGLEGTVELVLTYDGRGKFVEAKVRKSSGHKALDDAAVEAAVAAMGRMGRAPERTPELSIPYNFKIEDR